LKINGIKSISISIYQQIISDQEDFKKPKLSHHFFFGFASSYEFFQAIFSLKKSAFQSSNSPFYAHNFSYLL